MFELSVRFDFDVMCMNVWFEIMCNDVVVVVVGREDLEINIE